MTTNIRKTLVLLFTILLVGFAIPSQALEVYYEEDELTREIIIYEYNNEPDYQIKVYKPCSSRCPNETLSQGYSEPEPVRENPLPSNHTMMTVDPIILQMLMKRQFSGPYRY